MGVLPGAPDDVPSNVAMTRRAYVGSLTASTSSSYHPKSVELAVASSRPPMSSAPVA